VLSSSFILYIGMIQEQLITKKQADARGLTLDILVKPYLDSGYRIVQRTIDMIKVQRYVSPRDVKY
jgi:hypothetical protein